MQELLRQWALVNSVNSRISHVTGKIGGVPAFP